MSQRNYKLLRMEILSRISALYRVEHVTAQQRNELVELSKKGASDNFDALYLKCSTLPEHFLLEEIKEIIIFK